MNLRRYWIILVLIVQLLQSSSVLRSSTTKDEFTKAQDNTTDAKALRAMVEADWAAQERRRNRTLNEPAAVRDAYRRAEELL